MKKILIAGMLIICLLKLTSCTEAKAKDLPPGTLQSGDYIIMSTERNLSLLQTNVQSKVKQGWKPCGGIVFNGNFCYQSLYK